MSLPLNGTSQYAQVSDNAALVLGATHTIAGWIYRSDSAGSTEDQILYHGAYGDNKSIHIAWCHASHAKRANRVYILLEDAVGTTVDNAAYEGMAAGEWHHIAVTWDATTLTWYIDGMPQFNTGSMTAMDMDPALDPSGVMGLGRGATYGYLPGKLAEFAAWSSTLSAANITSLASGLAPSEVGSPIWYMPWNTAKDEVIVPLTVNTFGDPVFDADGHPVVSDATLEVWSVQAMSDTWVLPSTVAGETLSLSTRLCRGMREALSFCIRSNGYASVGVTVENPESPAPQLDIRYVKCWWQREAYAASPEGLVPELLLKDPGIVTVNTSSGTNTPAATFNDAETLQDIVLGRNVTQQYWVTVYVPPTAVTGTYTIPVTITKNAETDSTFNVTVEVLPFELSESPMEFYLYSASYLAATGTSGKTEEVYSAELANMKAHGFDTPTCKQPFWTYFGQQPDGVPVTATEIAGAASIAKIIELRAAAGLAINPMVFEFALGATLSENIWYPWWTGVPATPYPTYPSEEWTAAVGVRLTQLQYVKDFLAPLGVTDLYIFGADEISNPGEMAVLKPIYEAVQGIGIKIFNSVSAGGASVLANMGASVDACVTNDPTYDPAAWHAINKQVWLYGPTSPELPVLYYRNRYGISALRSKFDAVCPYIWFEAYGSPADMFDDTYGSYKTHNLTLPTANGLLIDTIQNEAMRAAKNDVDFAQTLVAHAGSVPDPTGLDLDDVRDAMIDAIIALRRPCIILT